MSTLLDQLNALFADAFEACGLERSLGKVGESQRPELCQFQCNGAMPAAKKAGKNPKELAEAVLANLKNKERFKDLSLAGPGFINISLTDEALKAALDAVVEDKGLGLPPASPQQKVIVDFGGPNVAKPMHVGHLRSAIIGECLKRLQRRLGHEVLGDVHLGDWGTQMGMLIEAVKEEQPGLPYFDASQKGPFPGKSPVRLEDLERLYPAMSGRCKADEALAEKARLATQELQAGRPGYRALWRHFVDVSIQALKADFGELGVSFDLWLGESDSQPEIPKMLADLEARKVAQKSEGATVILLPKEGNTEIPPLLLVKGDGAYLYGTTDLATLRERVRDHKASRILYVADKRQSLHFRQVFKGAEIAGYLGQAKAEHVAFGTVNGKDGKPFKTREGGVMRLRDLITMAVSEANKRMQENEVAKELEEAERNKVASQVALAAIKYADLMNHRTQDYVFDLDKFTRFEGRTGPYLLYAAVRMKAILRKSTEREQKLGSLLNPSDFERPLFLKILGYPEVLRRVGEESLPHALAEYAYDLSGVFSTFYQGCNIINETDQAKRGFWLKLTQGTLKVLEDALSILGFEVPERM